MCASKRETNGRLPSSPMKGLYEPTVMFFGNDQLPCHLPSHDERYIRGMKSKRGWLTVYMDDMLIATPDDLVFHKKCVHKILDKLEKHDLYLKPEKVHVHTKMYQILGSHTGK